MMFELRGVEGLLMLLTWLYDFKLLSPISDKGVPGKPTDLGAQLICSGSVALVVYCITYCIHLC